MDRIKYEDVRVLVDLAIEEDIRGGDITSEAIFVDGREGTGVIKAKENGIVCGCDMVRHVYQSLDPAVRVKVLLNDGEEISFPVAAVGVEGPVKSILAGERTALNFMQRMSGIATRTNRIVKLLDNSRIQILDTRKTVPGFRQLDKYSVKAGGGENHRQGLFDMVMIKDNHIRAAGGIIPAVELVRKKYGKAFLVEVEAGSLEEVETVCRTDADIIMLDNMDDQDILTALGIIKKKMKVEVSGNVNEERIKRLREFDIDYISIGVLTHSVTAFDLSMDIL